MRAGSTVLDWGMPAPENAAARGERDSSGTGIRALGRMHALYLASVAAIPLFHAEPLYGVCFFFSFAPLAVWYAILAQGYRITRHPLLAVLVVALVPLQVGASTYLLGGTLLDFALEEAFVETTGVLFGLTLAMAWRTPTGLPGLVVVLLLVLTPWLCLQGNYLLGLRDWPLWAQVLCATSILSATAMSVATFGAAAAAFNKTGEAQEVELVHGADDQDPTQGLELGERAGTAAPLLAVGVWFAAMVTRIVAAW